MREKRTAQVKAHIPPSMREQLELFAKAESNVISMSDYLFTVIEEHIAIRQAIRRSPMRVSHQKIGRRVGEQ